VTLRCRSLLVAALLALGTLLTLPGMALASDSGSSGPVLAQESSEALRGRVRGPDGALAGVTITVTRDGEAVGEATTDEDGNWRLDVPEPGTYLVTIDEAGLGEGLAVRDAERFASQEIEVAAGENKAVLFPVIAGEGGGPGRAGTGTTGRLINLAVTGLKLGAIIAITSVGLSLIFGVTGLVNFAHGELVTLGAIVAFYVNVAPDGSRRLPLIVGILVAVVVGGLAGAGLERGLFLPLRRRKAGLISLLVITIGLSFFVRHLFLVSSVYGPAPRKYVDYAVQRDPVTFGPISLPPRDLGVIVVSLLVLAGVGLLLQKTKLGTAMRAVADNRDLAESSGIDVKKVVLAVWILGGALAALGGTFQGLTVGAIEWDMGFALLLLMFAGVIVGGIGTAYGAMVGGLLVGLISELSTFWFSVELKLVFAFLVLIVVLLFRPQGIMGKRERFG
jgi:neutral amino acid transport system permease protein